MPVSNTAIPVRGQHRPTAHKQHVRGGTVSVIHRRYGVVEGQVSSEFQVVVGRGEKNSSTGRGFPSLAARTGRSAARR